MVGVNIHLKRICNKVHETALEKGWWQDYRPTSECLMLIVTEVAEACESDRKGDEEGLKRELADIIIRTADLCEWLGIDIEYYVKRKMKINKERPYKHGKRY